MTLYPDVLPTLSLLKDTYRLGLVTNGNTYSERCGLPGLFAFTIFAQDYQVPKPQPEFYERVLSETHTPSGVNPNIQLVVLQQLSWRESALKPLVRQNNCWIFTMRMLGFTAIGVNE